MSTGPTSATFFGSTWDDLVAPAFAVNPAGPDGSATLDTTDGTLRFVAGTAGGGNENQSCFVSFQVPHTYIAASDLYFHIHWFKTSSDSGTVKWQVKYAAADIGETFADLGAATWYDLTEIVSDGDTARKHAMAGYTISGLNLDYSGCILMAVRRNAEDANDTYEAAAAIASIDLHIQRGPAGSVAPGTML